MKFFNFKTKESKVGLYSTLIFHLVILIILLVAGIGSSIREESSFVLDFTKQEELEKLKEEQEFKEMVSAEVDEILAAAMRNSEIRNVAVNVNQQSSNVQNNMSDIYDDAKNLQDRLDAAKEKSIALNEKDEAFVASLNKKKENKEVAAYKGPSVISYNLEGREATFLSVPAYKGYESGDVSVKIYVNNAGRVVDVEAIASVSTTNESLIELALQAAKRSRFTASSSASKSQEGEIVYRFIGQKK